MSILTAHAVNSAAAPIKVSVSVLCTNEASNRALSTIDEGNELAVSFELNVVGVVVLAFVSSPSYVSPLPGVGVVNVANDAISDPLSGKMSGTTGGMGSGKLMSALSTLCSHDVGIGSASATGVDACIRLSD